MIELRLPLAEETRMKAWVVLAAQLILPLLARADTLYIPAEYPTIQSAVVASSSGDTLLLSHGVYYESDLYLEHGLYIFGDPLDPQSVTVDAGGASHALSAVMAPGPTSIRGLQIRNAETALHLYETGMAGLPILANCLIQDVGVGAQIEHVWDTTVQDCWFVNCSESGVYMPGSSSSLAFKRCRFADCQSTALWATGAVEVDSCSFVGNSSPTSGGAIFADAAFTARDCAFIANSAPEGAAIFGQDFSIRLLSGCTFASNSAPGGSIVAFNYIHLPGPHVEACLLAFNTCNTPISGQLFDGVGEFEVLCTDAYGNTGGDWVGLISGYLGVGGNILADPLFCDVDAGDYRVATTSPCLPTNNSCGTQIGAYGEGCSGQSTWYVATDGDDDTGSGGSDAPFATIGHALAVAAAGESILVACGTYLESNLEMVSGVVLRGGSLDPMCTVIDAQQQGHVLACRAVDADTRVERLTLTGGFIDSNLTDANAALWIESGAGPVVVDCRFVGNTAEGGGAIGAMGVGVLDSSPSFTRCEIAYNQNDSGRSGMTCSNSSVSLTDCRLAENYNYYGALGGALHCRAGSTVAVTGCSFVENRAGSGGAVYLEDSTLHLAGCVLDGNTAQYDGGGIYARSSLLTLTGCLVAGGHEADSGGGLSLSNSTASILGSTITANLTDWGGDSFGGGLVSYNSDVEFLNSVFWGNCSAFPSLAQDANIAGGSVSFECCIVDPAQIEGPVSYIGENFNQDPLFCDPADCGAAGGNYDVGAASICLPANNGCGVQMGAFAEGCSGHYAWRVATGGDDVGGTGSSEDPFATIGHALTFATDGDSILVAPGTYVEHGLDMVSGVALVGAPDSVGAVVIDAQGQGRHFQGTALAASTTIAGLTLSNGASTQGGSMLWEGGCVLQLADLVFVDNTATVDGGAVRCNQSAPSFLRCTFTGNSATGHAGALYLFEGSDATLDSCTITGNVAADGGGLRCYSSSPQLTACVVTGNAAHLGAGLYFYTGSAPNLDGCTIASNAATQEGGGIRCVESTPTLSATIIYANCAPMGAQLQLTDATSRASFTCCDVDTTSGWFSGAGIVSWLGSNYVEDPLFCDPADCMDAPTQAGDFNVAANSVCRPGNNDCSVQIGALEASCDPTAVDAESVPGTFRVQGVYPNPFNPTARVLLDLPASCAVGVDVYDLAGRHIAQLYQGDHAAGRMVVTWNGTDDSGSRVASGVYLLRAKTSGYAVSAKLVLLK